MKKIQVNGADYWENSDGVMIPHAMYIRQGARVRQPADVLGLLVEERMATQEHFVVITLDGSHKIIKKHVVTIGLADRSQVHPRETFRCAILDNAVAIMIAHNHPSGSLEASTNDLLTTRRLSEAGALLKIPVIDHLIVSPEGWVSLREHFPHYFTTVAK